MKRIILSLAVLASVIAGCRNEVKEGPKAHITFELSSEGEFVEPEPLAKASDDIQMDVNEFSLSIVNKENGQTVLSWPKYSEVPPVVSMDPGSYTVKAVSPGNKDVAWSQPIYEGATDVTISPGAVENISLICTISNMKVSVRCTEKFLSEMSDYSVTVSSSYGALIYTPEIISNGTSGYFKVAPLALDVKAVRKTGGTVNHHVEITSVAAKDHHVFTLDASETGYANLGEGLSIDYTVNNREEDILIDGLEENPVDDEYAVPELSGSSVTDGAVDVPLATAAVELTYSENVQLVSGKNVTLNGEICTASVSGSIVTVTLPELAASTSYTLSIPEGAVANAADNSKTAAAASITFTTAEEVVDPGSSIEITATAGIDAPVTYNKTSLPETFTLSVNATAGIEKYVVNIKTPGLQGLLDMMTMPYTVDLANMNEDEQAFWGALFSITSDDVKGKKDVAFEISEFLAAMPAEENVMEIVITDAGGASKTATLTIIMTE